MQTTGGIRSTPPGFLGHIAEGKINPKANSIIIRSENQFGDLGFGDGGGFNGFEFTSLDWMDQPGGILVGVTVENISGVTGLDDTDILNVTDHGFDVNLGDTVWSIGASVELILETDHGEPVIPEPATLSLLGLGLSGIRLIRRRRTRSSIHDWEGSAPNQISG